MGRGIEDEDSPLAVLFKDRPRGRGGAGVVKGEAAGWHRRLGG